MDTFRSGGSGGQNVNKRDTGVRVVHEPSGAEGKSTEERSQLQNKKAAFKRMVDTDKFHLWLRIQLGHVSMMDAEIGRSLAGEVKVEVKRNGVWTEV